MRDGEAIPVSYTHLGHKGLRSVVGVRDLIGIEGLSLIHIYKPMIIGLKANIHEIARTFCTAYPLSLIHICVKGS